MYTHAVVACVQHGADDDQDIYAFSEWIVFWTVFVRLNSEVAYCKFYEVTVKVGHILYIQYKRTVSTYSPVSVHLDQII